MIAALVDRPVVVDGQEYPVRPPTVREALVVLHCTEGAARLDADDLATLQATARGWLPPGLYSSLFPVPPRWKRWPLRLLPARLRAPLEAHLDLQSRLLALAGVKAVSDIVAAEIAPPEPNTDVSEAANGPQQTPQAIDWSQLVAEYARAYGVRPSTVLDEPWPLFIELAGRISALEARDDLRLLTVRSLPYISDDGEREALLDDLRRRARLPGHTPEDRALAAEREQKTQALLHAARLAGALALPKK